MLPALGLINDHPLGGKVVDSNPSVTLGTPPPDVILRLMVAVSFTGRPSATPFGLVVHIFSGTVPIEVPVLMPASVTITLSNGARFPVQLVVAGVPVPTTELNVTEVILFVPRLRSITPALKVEPWQKEV